jgi:hypothetical protein
MQDQSKKCILQARLLIEVGLGYCPLQEMQGGASAVEVDLKGEI